MLKEDLDVREFLKKKLAHALVGKFLFSALPKMRELLFLVPVLVLLIGNVEQIQILKAELERMGVPVMQISVKNRNLKIMCSL